MRARFLALLACLALAPAHAQECPRIVSQSPYITKSLQWLGLGRCIVGASRYDDLAVTATGGVMDPEYTAIAGLDPDLMVTSTWTDPAAWRANAPPGTRTLVLDGFGSMAEVAANLRRLAGAAGGTEARARADRFPAAWRKRARTVDGAGRRVLLLSACGGAPYSYGRTTWLDDLFTTAGFRLAETREGARPAGPGEPAEAIGALVARTRPDILFVFHDAGMRQCPLLAMELPVRIVPLNGEHFLHPAPVLLEGLAELAAATGEMAAR